MTPFTGTDPGEFSRRYVRHSRVFGSEITTHSRIEQRERFSTDCERSRTSTSCDFEGDDIAVVAVA